jgi:long-chain acyl-CoA synthetase
MTVATSTSYPVDQLLHWAEQTPDATWLIQHEAGAVRSMTWREAADDVGRMASALKAQNWPADSRVAIAGMNCAHWFLADLAIQMAGLVPVGIYARQASRTTQWILTHCDAKAIFIGPMPSSVAADMLQQGLPANILTIAMPYAASPAAEHSWAGFVSSHLPLRRYEKPSADTLATLIYTSGTTGDSKGVMLSYGNLAFTSAVFREVIPAKPGERLFSYLPLAHILERVAVEMASLYWGAEVYFLERVEKMSEQLMGFKPTRFVTVPLVLSRLQTSFTARIPERQLRALVKRRWLGPLLRKRMVTRLGLQHSRALFCGAAPTPQATLLFFRDVLGIDVYECYGQSEALYCSMNRPGAQRLGSVGKPFSDANLRLSKEGEIQVRHPGVMIGYFNDAKQTAAAFTADGWLKTGDKGRFDDDGYLYITGRVKEIFKTAKGKYVAPGPIEAAFMGSNDDIDQCCLMGVQLTQPVMVVSLSCTALSKPRAEVEAGLLADMERVNAPLEDHEKIAKLLLVSERWSVESGLLTPTLKVRRNQIEARYTAAVTHVARRREVLVGWQ